MPTLQKNFRVKLVQIFDAPTALLTHILESQNVSIYVDLSRNFKAKFEMGQKILFIGKVETEIRLERLKKRFDYKYLSEVETWP